MTYEEAVRAIDGLETFRAAGPGLERMQALLARMGNPEKKLRYIHVAGTNGKGSTCVMLSEILRAAGYNTGLYVSPHVVEFTERMQLNGEEIPREELVSLVEEYLPLALSLREGGCAITEFEFITAIAFAWFAQKGCDIVVLEVGMGGRFDATNAIPSALISVICSISLDHTKILGDTVETVSYTHLHAFASFRQALSDDARRQRGGPHNRRGNGVSQQIHCRDPRREAYDPSAEPFSRRGEYFRSQSKLELPG